MLDRVLCTEFVGETARPPESLTLIVRLLLEGGSDGR